MGSLKDPRTWVPIINPNKDCSQKICTISCTHWCKYIILPSPPPPPPPPSKDGTALSPAAVVIITLIGSFLFLICYYLIVRRYCSRINESSVVLRRHQIVDHQETHDQAEDHSSVYIPWVVLGKGLDEAFVKSIADFKYKKEDDGLVTCTDCSVCLGEFQEGESIKLLPKCNHAFHAYCIDTWLKTHLSCPLCRANICCDVKTLPPVSPTTPTQTPPQGPSLVMKTETGESDHVTFEIREGDQMRMIKSKSMNNLCQTRASTAQVLVFNRTQETTRRKVGSWDDVGSSENVLEGSLQRFNLVDVISHFGVK